MEGGQKLLAPPGVLISFSRVLLPFNYPSFLFPPPSCLIFLSYFLIFIPVPFCLSSSFPFFTLFHFSHFFPFPLSAFLPSLLIPHICSSVQLFWLVPSPSQSLSPVDSPGSLFLVPCSSSSLSPPAAHAGCCGPGCHQWRKQRQLLHHVSGWLFGCCDSHLREW